MLVSDFVLMSVQVQGVVIYTFKNKPSENNSNNKNVSGDRKMQKKYVFLAVENVSEKSNNQHTFYRNTNMKIK